MVFNVKYDKTKVFGDNRGCIELATEPKYRSRTKHISLKFHFFRNMVGKHLEINYIDTKEQQADMMTKPLEKQHFGKLKKLVLGW